MLLFVDETGASPLQPGIRVTVTDPNGNTQTGYTIAGGAVPAIALANGMMYVATFYAERGPTAPQSFLSAPSGNTVVTVLSYRSPNLSASAAQQLLAEVFPRGRANPQGAPNTFAIQSALGASDAALDSELQLVHGALRLLSSSGSAIDSWALDFLGPSVIPRATAEPDVTYMNRILAWLLIPFGTLYGLQLAINMYLATYVTGGTISGSQALDAQGALGVEGGLDGHSQTSRVAIPTVLVFDSISNPPMAKAVGLIAADAQFCIFLAYPGASGSPGWELGVSEIDVNAFLGSGVAPSIVGPPSPDFAALVQLVKPGGSVAVYASNQTMQAGGDPNAGTWNTQSYANLVWSAP